MKPPKRLVIDLVDGEFIALGTETRVALQEAREAIIEACPQAEEEALRLEDLLKDAGVKRGTGQTAVEELMREAAITRRGSGKRGDPYRYWKNIPPRPDVVVAERNQKDSVSTSNISVAERNGDSDYFSFCRNCRAEVEHYDQDGEPWCEAHFAEAMVT